MGVYACIHSLAHLYVPVCICAGGVDTRVGLSDGQNVDSNKLKGRRRHELERQMCGITVIRKIVKCERKKT